MESKLDTLLAQLTELTKKVDNQNARIGTIEQSLRIKPVQPEVAKKTIEQKSVFQKPLATPPHIKKNQEPEQAFEVRFGKYALQVIGIGVFLFGMGFLLKYSLQQGWVKPIVRIIAGFVVATGLIGAAELFGKRLQQWAFGLTAGGIILYYLTIYASYAFYDLLSLQQAFVALLLVAMGATVLALRHDSRLIAVFSLVGGMAAPLVLYVDKFDKYFLLYYLLSLAVGFLVISYIKQWFILSWLSFGGLVLYKMFFISLPLEHALLFYMAVFVLYAVVPFIYAMVTKTKDAFFESAIITAAAVYAFSACINRIMYHLFYQREAFRSFFPVIASVLEQATRTQVLKYASLIFGTIFLIKAVIAYFLDKGSQVFYAVARLAILFIAAFISTHWHGLDLSSALYVYALIILLLGIFVETQQIRWWSYLFWCIGLVNFMLAGFDRSFMPVSWWHNKITIVTVIGVVLCCIASYVTQRYQNILQRHEKTIYKRFDWMAILIIFYWMNTAVWHYPYHILGLAWFAYILFFIGLHAGHHVRVAAYAIGLYAMSCFIVAHNDLLHASSIQLHSLFASFALILVGVLILYKRYKQTLLPEERDVIPAVSQLGLAAAFFFWGRATILTHLGFFSNRESQPRIHVILTIYYGVYALLLILIGLFKKERFVRYCGLAILGLTMYKLWFIIMGMPETLHRIIAFILVGVLFILASFAYQMLSADEKKN